MSLDFSYGDVADQSVMWDENNRMKPEVESLIFNTMTIGINKITADNYQTFYVRYCMYYASKGYETFYDLAFVKSMIGLHTNASPISDAQFKKQCIENLVSVANLKLNKELNAMGIL